jgi:hypothetical protein
LIQRYGKERVIKGVLRLRDNSITVQVEGALTQFTGPPAPEFVTPETLALDLEAAGGDLEALEAAIGEEASPPLQPQDCVFRRHPRQGPPPGRKPLWSVERDGRHILLLGSVHLMRPEDYPLPRGVEEAYAASRTIAFEMDVGQLRTPWALGEMTASALNPAGRGLAQTISAKTRELFETKVAALGLSMAQFDRFKPWLSAIMVMGIALQRLGYDPELGVDRHLWARAKKEGKSCLYLETLEEQIGLFAAMDDREQDSLLRQALTDMEMARDMAPLMVEAWRSGDMDRLGGLMHASFTDHHELYERLMVRRNRAWLPRVESFLEREGSTLVVVGAGHLAGRGGLLELLSASGCSVTQH